MTEQRTYTIDIDGGTIVLTQDQMDAFLDAAGPMPATPDEGSDEHISPATPGPGVITVTTSDDAPFSYHGRRLPNAEASWYFLHALSEAIHRLGTSELPQSVEELFKKAE